MKCAESVLGEFSSGVSVCRNESTQTGLGATFLPGAPSGWGVRGALPPVLVQALYRLVKSCSLESNFYLSFGFGVFPGWRIDLGYVFRVF